MAARAPLVVLVARVFAGTFALAGVAGYIPNPLIGDGALFVTNGAHNVVHLATAALFGVVSAQGALASRILMRAFGIVYFLIGVVGLVVLAGASSTMLFGVVHINQLDNFLHLVLGAAIAAAGFLLPIEAPSHA